MKAGDQSDIAQNEPRGVALHSGSRVNNKKKINVNFKYIRVTASLFHLIS